MKPKTMSISMSWRGLRSVCSVGVLAFLAGLVVLLAGVLGSLPAAWADSCPNEAFRTGPSAALPDCRAYEMVSPDNKNGGEVDGGIHKGAMAAPEQAAADGEAVTYASTSAFTAVNPASAVVSSQYLSRRTADGWQTHEIVPAQQLPEGRLTTLGEGTPDFSLFQGFGEDLQAGFLLAWDPQPDPLAPAGYFNPYLFDASSGGYQLLSGVIPPVQKPGNADLGYEGFGVVYGGVSSDAQHVIFEANDALTAEAVPGRVNLYEWSAGRGLELVSVLPEGTVDTSGTPYPIGANTTMTFGAPNPYEDMPNLGGALSSDGLRAFWSGGSMTGGRLYMHEIVGSGARTVNISASQNPAVTGGSGSYWTANPEGSLVYFTSGEQLTVGSTATAGGQDLYEYNVDTGQLSDLTVDGNAGETAGVLGVLGMGESGGVPSVYFVARGVLAAGATAGGNNLYVSHGGASVPVFIATLGSYEGETIDFEFAVKKRTSRVSPNGQLLAFQSAEPLTGYDDIPAGGQPCPKPRTEEGNGTYYQEPPEGRCTEVYEYDVRGASLTCVSCEPGGLPPTSDSVLPETFHLYEDLRGWESSSVQQRYLLDDGRLFFQSENALLPQATNGHENIYEYEPEGVGQCAASGSGDCVYLISTGESSSNSYFADASTDGRDVFFLTSEQLLAQDGDEAIDVYDAREDGGFSSAQPPPCSGEACKPAITPAPAIYGAPPSATFQGAGDIASPPTARPSTKGTTSKKTRKKKKSKSRKRKRKNTKRKARGLAGRSERGRR
jgi:hypothetical protein